jgi:hypothetical protein
LSHQAEDLLSAKLMPTMWSARATRHARFVRYDRSRILFGKFAQQLAEKLSQRSTSAGVGVASALLDAAPGFGPINNRRGSPEGRHVAMSPA